MGDVDDGSTQAEIMAATYRALCRQGYASLTMQDIADELEKSKSLLHYHFESKDALLAAFIEYLLARFEREVAALEGPPADRLEAFVDRFVVDDSGDDREALHLALLELRAQAPYTDRYRDPLARSDAVVREAVAEIVRDGIDQGVFRADADPEGVARLVVAAMDGARMRGLTIGEESYAAIVREELYAYVLADLEVPPE